jgi:two-component system cell cycle response regulator DivK
MAAAKAVILVVEDNPDNMYVLDHLLTRSGYAVQQAVRGDEALALMEHRRPDLVLMDMQMPGMDGYGVVQQLRRQPALADVPVIAVTASSMPGDREAILQAGCTDYVAKPIDPRALLQLIAQYLEGGDRGKYPDR